MLSLSPIKLVVILAVILVVLGPDKLPDVARQLGGAWRSLREWQAKIEKEVREVVPDLPSSQDIVRMARSPVNMLNQLADRVSDPVTFTPGGDDEAPAGSTVDSPVAGPVPHESPSPPIITTPPPVNPPSVDPVPPSTLSAPADPSLN